MKKYIVLYHTPAEAEAQAATASPEDQAAGIASWMAWAARCGEHLVDPGAPLMQGRQLTPDGRNQPGNKGVAGYSILQADSLDAAITLLQGHPHLSWHAACSIEIHETRPVPGME